MDFKSSHNTLASLLKEHLAEGYMQCGERGFMGCQLQIAQRVGVFNILLRQSNNDARNSLQSPLSKNQIAWSPTAFQPYFPINKQEVRLCSQWKVQSLSFSFDSSEEALFLNLAYLNIASTFGSTDPLSSTDDDHKNHITYWRVRDHFHFQNFCFKDQNDP